MRLILLWGGGGQNMIFYVKKNKHKSLKKKNIFSISESILIPRKNGNDQ